MDTDFSTPLEEQDDAWLRARVVEMADRLRAGESGCGYSASTTRPDGVIVLGGQTYDDRLWDGIWSGITPPV